MAENNTKGKKTNTKRIVLILAEIIALVAAGIYYYLNYRSIRAHLLADSSAEIPVQTGKGDSNILIVYFTLGENSNVDAISSASVTAIDNVAYGNVRVIADEIQKQTGGELFSVQQADKYDANYGSVVDAALQEQKNDARPALSSHIVELDKYDTIFIGYPTWWNDLPQGMYTFFDEYDLSGKKILLFNSANGSGEAGTFDKVRELEADAEVETNGLSVVQGDIDDCSQQVKEWLSKIGY